MVALFCLDETLAAKLMSADISTVATDLALGNKMQ